MNNPLYYLNFSTDEQGNFDNVILPPDQYMYTFSLEEGGSRYLDHGQMNIPIGMADLDMGDISSDLKYQVSGSVTLNDVETTGMVILRPVDDFDNFTVLEATVFEDYSGYMLPGEYYVTFQDGQYGKHYSYGGFLDLTAPTNYDLELKNEGYVRGDVRSQADNNVITDRSVRIQFVSETGVVFVEDSDPEEGGVSSALPDRIEAASHTVPAASGRDRLTPPVWSIDRTQSPARKSDRAPASPPPRVCSSSSAPSRPGASRDPPRTQ